MGISQNKNDLIVFHTDHFINRTITQFFAKSNNYSFFPIQKYSEDSHTFIASYGILRGTEQIFKKSKNFIYLDHGYIGSSGRKFNESKTTTIINLNGFFRIIKNDFYFNTSVFETNPQRFNNLNIDLKDLNKNGKNIILSEPSSYTLEFLNIPNWTQDVLNEIKKYTDRKIIIHNKFSDTPLDGLLENAFAFVSCQSTAGFKAIAQGVPSYFTHHTMQKYGNIQNIEDRKLNHELLFAAANSQWKLCEFFSDDFKEFMHKLTI